MSSNYGAATALVAGTLTLAQQSGQQWYFIANTDTDTKTLTFKDAGSNTLGQLPLNPAGATGQMGGIVDSQDFPILLDAVTVVITGTGTSTFASGASKHVPHTNFNSDIPIGR